MNGVVVCTYNSNNQQNMKTVAGHSFSLAAMYESDMVAVPNMEGWWPLISERITQTENSRFTRSSGLDGGVLKVVLWLSVSSALPG